MGNTFQTILACKGRTDVSVSSLQFQAHLAIPSASSADRRALERIKYAQHSDDIYATCHEMLGEFDHARAHRTSLLERGQKLAPHAVEAWRVAWNSHVEARKADPCGYETGLNTCNKPNTAGMQVPNCTQCAMGTLQNRFARLVTKANTCHVGSH